jgi:hypothetical protein
MAQRHQRDQRVLLAAGPLTSVLIRRYGLVD